MGLPDRAPRSPRRDLLGRLVLLHRRALWRQWVRMLQRALWHQRVLLLRMGLLSSLLDRSLLQLRWVLRRRLGL